jgi:hypothetical protein
MNTATTARNASLAVRTVFEAAKVIVSPADLINVAVEQLRLEQCELPSFSTLDRMVNRVRTVVHRRVFAEVLRKLSPENVARLDGLLENGRGRPAAHVVSGAQPLERSNWHSRTIPDCHLLPPAWSGARNPRFRNAQPRHRCRRAMSWL